MPEKVADHRRGDRAAVVRVAVANAEGEVGSAAVQNCSSRRGKWLGASSASVAAVLLLLADELDEGSCLSSKNHQRRSSVDVELGNLLQITLLLPSQNKEDQAQVVSNLKSISMSSSKLLLAAKALSADPTAPNLKNQLAAAAR